MGAERYKPGLLRRLKIAYFQRVGKRRRYLRVPLRAKVTNLNTEMFEFFSSTNISVGGMFLKAEEPYSVGTNVKLEFSLPGEKDKMVIDGKVVRVSKRNPDKNIDPGMGVQFTKIDPLDYDTIEKFVGNVRTG